jgi:hypothetical protein
MPRRSSATTNFVLNRLIGLNRRGDGAMFELMTENEDFKPALRPEQVGNKRANKSEDRKLCAG